MNEQKRKETMGDLLQEVGEVGKEMPENGEQLRTGTLAGGKTNQAKSLTVMTCVSCGVAKDRENFNSLIRMSRPATPAYTVYCANCYLDQLCDNDHAADYISTIKRRLNGNVKLLGIVENWEKWQ